MIKKLIPYILILIIFVGFLSPKEEARAAEQQGTCTYTVGSKELAFDKTATTTEANCPPEVGKKVSWIAITSPNPSGTASSSASTPTPDKSNVPADVCSFNSILTGGSFMGCIKDVITTFLFSVPAFILTILGYFFNFIIHFSLTGSLPGGGSIYNDSFITLAWGIVRDFSNLFFILVLLYIAIETILNIGHDAQKKIAQVVILAMLINFSMFFTQVIIDSSNMLALVFYNKIATIRINSSGENAYDPLGKETDLSGALIGKYDPSKITDGETIKQAGKIFAKGQLIGAAGALGIALLIGLTMYGGMLFFIGIFVFLIVVIAFFNRLASLMFSIIFSPFAFMSYSIPYLKKLKYIGWDDWLKRLIKEAFFAPIFMFFLYFIFMMLKNGLIARIMSPNAADLESPAGFIKMILVITLGFNLIMLLLWYAINFAYKNSGKAGEMVVTMAKAAGSIALAVATDGASLALTSTVGKSAAKAASNPELKRRAAEGHLPSQLKLAAYDKLSKASFDVKKLPGAGALAGAAGLKLRETPKIFSAIGLNGTEGGFVGRTERTAKGLKKRAELYKTSETDDQVKERTTAENAAATSEYNKKKNEARRSLLATNGGLVTPEQTAAFEKDFAENNHISIPQIFTSAKAYNNMIMKKFADSLPEKGLLGSQAYVKANSKGELVDNKNYNDSGAYKKHYEKKYNRAPKKEDLYDEEVAKSANAETIRKTKVSIGGAKAAGEAKFSAELEKGFKSMSKVTDRIKENSNIIKDLNKTLENYIERDATGKDTGKGFVNIDKDKGFVVNTEKIEERLSELAAATKRDEFRLQKLVEQGLENDHPDMKSATAQLSANRFEITKLEKLKNVPRELHNKEMENLKLHKEEHHLEESQKPHDEPAKGGGGHAEKPKAAHKEEPAHEEHPPAGGEHGH